MDGEIQAALEVPNDNRFWQTNIQRRSKQIRVARTTVNNTVPFLVLVFITIQGGKLGSFRFWTLLE
jgi:hypothetical protein